MRDATELATDQPVDAIVVTGDIAFSGKREEYEIAIDWLENLCEAIGCPVENVWLVAGNHDVDRSVIDSSVLLRDLHEKLRSAATENLDSVIRECITDEMGAKLLYAPLENYNEFASRFGCAIDANQPFWETDLTLNDGSILRLRGLNSTLVSDSLDDQGAHRMVLGTAQVLMKVEEGVEFLTLCHHPPSWLLDQDESESYLTQRARLQLYGHKHKFQTDRINNSVRLEAGAVHPSRREQNWDPRYNYVVLKVENTDETRTLAVDIRPRVWHKEQKSFGPHPDLAGEFSRRHDLQLSAWAAPTLDASLDVGVEELKEPDASARPESGGRPVNRERRLVYRFLSLPYPKRLTIAQRLGLIEDEDDVLRGRELDRQVLERARHAGRLGELWDEVVGSNSSSAESQNPFDLG